jgi:hypothetical protein
MDTKKDMCQDEIGLCVENVDVLHNSRFSFKHNWEGQCHDLKEKQSPLFDLLYLVHLNANYGIRFGDLCVFAIAK